MHGSPPHLLKATLPAALAFLLAAPTTALCQFVTCKGRLALGNPPDVQAVQTLTNDSVIVTAVRGKVEYASKLVTIDRRTGHQIASRKTDGFASEAKFVRINGADRLALISVTRTEQADLTLYDLDHDGQIAFRAHTALPIPNGSRLVLSARANAGFLLAQVPPNGFELVAFSLDNGQVLSRTNVGSTTAPILVFEGATTQILVADYQPQSVGFRFVDVTDPVHPVDPGRVAYQLAPPAYAGAVTSGASTPDGRYAVYADNLMGLAVIDIAQRRVVGYARTPFPPATLQIRERDGRRLVSMARAYPNSPLENEIALFDATDPAHPSLIAQRTTRDYVGDLRFSPDGTQLISVDTYGLIAYDQDELAEAWNIPFEDGVRRSSAGLEMVGGEVLGCWSEFEIPKFKLGSFAVPTVTAVFVQGRDLLVRGTGFAGASEIEIDGVAVPTRLIASRDDTLRFKHGLDNLTPGSTVAVAVRNGLGIRSSGVAFAVPLSLER